MTLERREKLLRLLDRLEGPLKWAAYVSGFVFLFLGLAAREGQFIVLGLAFFVFGYFGVRQLAERKGRRDSTDKKRSSPPR